MNAPSSRPALLPATRRDLPLRARRGFFIAPLGAGKGAAALTALAELIRDGHRRHALVIAPKLVATTVWPAEVAAWPHLRHLASPFSTAARSAGGRSSPPLPSAR